MKQVFQDIKSGETKVEDLPIPQSKNGEVLINELAPRPHNSGHLTIEGCCPTSQFEQQVSDKGIFFFGG